MKLLLYARTLRHLRWEQVAFRALHVARERVRHRVPALAALQVAGRGPVPRVRLALHAPDQDARALAHEEARAFLEGTLSFVGEQRPVTAPIDWNPPGTSRLWRYHLHYLDVLKPLAALSLAGDAHARAHGERVLQEWLTAHPVGHGEGWEPYPTSLRLVNLLVWAAAHPHAPEIAASCATHAHWITGRLERHLLGNHLLKNLKALLMAGLALEGLESERWQRVALARLVPEIREQVLADGGHFERSPMYHLVALEDLLEIVACYRATGLAEPAFLRDAAARMARFTAQILHPDGEIPLFNDAALGQAPAPRELLALADGLQLVPFAANGWRRALWTGRPAARETAHTPPEPTALRHLPDTGLQIVREGPVALLFDTGPIGPDHLPGHAHADTLSFELSLAGARWIVDGGTAGYEGDPFRMHLRSAAAHNTVEVDGRSADELWGCFRVARRSRPGRAHLRRVGAAVHLRGEVHSAFGWIHRRDLFLWPAHGLVLVDRIDGAAARSARARLHFHPDVHVAPDGDGFRLERDAMTAWLRLVHAPGPAELFRGQHDPCEGWVALRFGPPVPAPTLRIPITPGTAAVYAFHWSADFAAPVHAAEGTYRVQVEGTPYRLVPEGAFHVLETER
jgi:uncharacterized heparinase superfamily protein